MVFILATTVFIYAKSRFVNLQLLHQINLPQQILKTRIGS